MIIFIENLYSIFCEINYDAKLLMHDRNIKLKYTFKIFLQISLQVY